MRADVRICDRTRIDLASHHERSTPDLEILLVASQKRRNRFLRNVSHHTQAPIYSSRIGFQFSHRGMIRLSRFGKPRVGQIDSQNIEELRRTNWTSKQHCSCPAGLYSKAERGSLQLDHLV